MNLGKEELNWMKTQVKGISENFVESERSSFGDGLDRATQETLDIIGRLESSLVDTSTQKAKHKMKVLTLIGHDPINLENNVNEFLVNEDYYEIIDINWTHVEYKRDNMVVFYANITYTEVDQDNTEHPDDVKYNVITIEDDVAFYLYRDTDGRIQAGNDLNTYLHSDPIYQLSEAEIHSFGGKYMVFAKPVK